jgi:hypothetical protein
MSFQSVNQSRTQNSQNSFSRSQFSPRPFPVQKTQDSPTPQEIENQAFAQDKFEATGLQLKEKSGTITPVEQERLGLLQAKMDSFWVQRLEQAKAQPNLLEILSRNAQPTPTIQAPEPAVTIQPKLTIGEPNDLYEQEADYMAEQVMSMAPPVTPSIQRQTEDDESEKLQPKLLVGTITSIVQRQDEPEDEELQKPAKQVSSKAMGRIDKAREAIKHAKSVFVYGAGNQTEAVKATNFNSRYRLKVMRDNPPLLEAFGVTSFWELTDEVKPIAAANPEALTAAKADLAQGGNCDEHAQVALDYLRVNAVGETLNRVAVSGLDHAFLLIGDIKSDSDADLVACDPWPTKATATTWEDHFAYTSKRRMIQISGSMVADGKSAKSVIAAGLTLTDVGKKALAMKDSDQETEESLKQSKAFRTEPDAAAKGHDYHYHV